MTTADPESNRAPTAPSNEENPLRVAYWLGNVDARRKVELLPRAIT